MPPKPEYSFLEVASIITMLCAAGMVPFAVVVSFFIDRKTMKYIVLIAAGMAAILAVFGLALRWLAGL